MNLAVDVRECAVGWSDGVYLGVRAGVLGLDGGFQLVDAGRGVDVQGTEDVALVFGDLGALAEGSGGAGEGADVDAVELPAQFRPGGAAGVLGDAGEEQASSRTVTAANDRPRAYPPTHSAGPV